MRMQKPDDLDALPFLPIDHQMRPAGVDTHRRCELITLPGHFWILSEEIKQREEAIRVAIGLAHPPCRGPLKPEGFKISFCGRSKRPTAILRHALRAFEP